MILMFSFLKQTAKVIDSVKDTKFLLKIAHFVEI